MSLHRFSNTTSWYRALTLVERLSSARPVPSLPSLHAPHATRAQQRLQRWKSQKPFDDQGVFERRLALDGLTEDALLSLLAEPVESVRAQQPQERPEWLRTLEQAFSAHAPASAETVQAMTEALPESQRPLGGLFTLIAPLIDQGRAQLQQGLNDLLSAYPEAPFSVDVERLLLPILPTRLLWMIHRSLALEINVCRVQGRLSGETPQARFQHFVKLLSQREFALGLLEEYPVLARQVINGIRQWVQFSLEFLQRLCEDWTALRELLGPEPLQGVLVDIDGGKGDQHNDGRSVLFARLSSGTRLVYKPRSLAVEVHFQELLCWLNQRGMEPAFRTLKVLNRGTHGWVEYVRSEGCDTTAEVERFHERQGGHLALLHAIRAADFHAENLIAAGEHPVLTDLEALFHPPPQRRSGIQVTHVVQMMSASVLSVGLLPGRALLEAGGSDGLEMSGMGGGSPQLWPHATPVITGAGTDTMQFAHRHLLTEGCTNRPTLQGQQVDVTQHAESILRGFTRVYDLLLEHREALCAPAGPLARFGQDEVRVVLRTTYTYSHILRKSCHPDVLRDALDRDRFFDTLWVGAVDIPRMQQVFAAEREDLHNGDIPIFTTHPDSRDLWTSRGERIADFFETPAMERVRQHIQSLSAEDLERQRWFIRASLTTLTMGGERAVWSRYERREPTQEASPERMLAAARAVGDRLERLAVRGAQDVGWVGLTIVNDRHWTLVPTRMDLCAGTAGLALFLGYLGDVTGEARYTELAKLSLDTARRLGIEQRRKVKQIGCSGWGGFIYALAHLGDIWREPALLAEAEAAIAPLEALIEKDEALDILNGAAGAILGMLSLHRTTSSHAALDAAVRCGERLLATAQPMSQGLGWHVKSVAAWPLTGFSHGAAGVALALLELATATGEARFRDAAHGALAYERSLFSPKARNWADLRVPDDTPVEQRATRFSAGWCHGAPGIGMARIRSLPHLEDAAMKMEIGAALQITLEHGFGRNHSLCHGDLGNLELLLLASRAFGDASLKRHTYRLAGMILDSIDAHGWLCGVPLGVETPGLMTGLAGIGYGLLRLAHPERVPSVLTLESRPFKASTPHAG